MNLKRWFEEDFLEWLSVHGSIQFWVVLTISLIGNVWQYAFFKGVDKNLGTIVDAYEYEQLENFDLNRAIHEKNLLIFELSWKFEDCKSMLKIIEEETDGSIAVGHTLEE